MIGGLSSGKRNSVDPQSGRGSRQNWIREIYAHGRTAMSQNTVGMRGPFLSYIDRFLSRSFHVQQNDNIDCGKSSVHHARPCPRAPVSSGISYRVSRISPVRFRCPNPYRRSLFRFSSVSCAITFSPAVAAAVGLSLHTVSPRFPTPFLQPVTRLPSSTLIPERFVVPWPSTLKNT